MELVLLSFLLALIFRVIILLIYTPYRNILLEFDEIEKGPAGY